MMRNHLPDMYTIIIAEHEHLDSFESLDTHIATLSHDLK